MTEKGDLIKVPYIYKRVHTKHMDFVTRTKCFYYNPERSKQSRGVRSAKTGESKDVRNKRNAYLKRKYDILNNFDLGDMWITLTWSKEALGERTNDDACKVLRDVMSRIRKKLSRKGIPFVWYISDEASENVRIHHHLIIKNNFDVVGELFSQWKEYGKVKDMQEIYDFTGGRLIKYFLDGGDHKELSYRKFSHSRNLKAPEVEVRVYPFDSFRANPKPPKSDDELTRWEIRNLYNGFPDIDGYIYQEYELVKVRIKDDGRGVRCSRKKRE